MNGISPAIAPSRVGVVGACWYLPPGQFLKSTDRFLVEAVGAFPAERQFVAMKGALSGGRELRASEWLLGGGPFLDISAYASGCARLPDDLPLYLIFNDTLFTRHPWRMIARRLAGIRDSLTAYLAPAAAAEVHPSTDLLLSDAANASRRHLSTFCVLLNNQGFRIFRELLGDLPASADIDTVNAWIDARVAAFPALKALLHVHLFGPRTPWSWKQNHAELIQRKAVTVVFEYMFTAKLLAGGMGMPINHGIEYRLRSRLGRHG